MREVPSSRKIGDATADSTEQNEMAGLDLSKVIGELQTSKTHDPQTL